MNNKFRRFCIQRSYYFDTHDKDGKEIENALSESEWKEMILKQWTDFEALNIDENLIIFHDADLNEDGTEKGLHAHCVPHFKNPVSQESAMKKFGASSIQNCTHCKNYSGAVQYLLHITQDAINAMKTIYLPEKIIGYALDKDGDKIKLSVREIQERMRRKTEKKKAEQEQVKSDLIIEVSEGRLLPSDVRELYKRDEYGVGLNILQYQKDKSLYVSAEKEYLEECGKFYETHDHPASLIYITGGGGLGKNELALAIARRVADARGVHMVGAEGKKTTFDLAGKYNGQKVSIIDELSPESFPLAQFLSVFDSKHAKIVNSRNADKAYFPETVLFTTSTPLEKFLYMLWKPYAHDNAQLPALLRRNLINGNTSEMDWHRAYCMSPNGFDIGNRFVQLRRRFAVYVVIRPDKCVEIRVFDPSANLPYSMLFSDPTFPKMDVFPLYNVCAYDISMPPVDFVKQADKVARAVLSAVQHYYEVTGYMRPQDAEKPFIDAKNENAENCEKEQQNDDDDESLDDFIQFPL